MMKAEAANKATQIVAKLVEAGKVPEFTGDAADRGEKVAKYLSAVLVGLTDTLGKVDLD